MGLVLLHPAVVLHPAFLTALVKSKLGTAVVRIRAGGSPYFVLFYTLVFGKTNAKVFGDSNWETDGLGSSGISSCDHQPSAFQGDVRSSPKGTLAWGSTKKVLLALSVWQNPTPAPYLKAKVILPTQGPDLFHITHAAASHKHSTTTKNGYLFSNILFTCYFIYQTHTHTHTQTYTHSFLLCVFFFKRPRVWSTNSLGCLATGNWACLSILSL